VWPRRLNAMATFDSAPPIVLLKLVQNRSGEAVDGVNNTIVSPNVTTSIHLLLLPELRSPLPPGRMHETAAHTAATYQDRFWPGVPALLPARWRPPPNESRKDKYWVNYAGQT